MLPHMHTMIYYLEEDDYSYIDELNERLMS